MNHFSDLQTGRLLSLYDKMKEMLLHEDFSLQKKD
jgi:hypothetical protein